MKSSLMAVLLFAVGGVRAADPTISITATPRYPWNGKVDLAFTIADSDDAGGYAEAEPGDELIPGRRLKYVQSSGTEQLNTGIVPNSKNTIELKIAWESQPGVNGCLFCARGATTSTSTFTGFLIGSKWRFDYNGTTGTESATPTLVSGKAVVIRDVAGTASVDGTSVQSHTAASFTVGGPLTLFSSYVTVPGTTVGNHVCAKVYYLRIYDNDGVTLVHDFQPWEKNGEIGLYDLVAKRFVAPNVGSLSAGVKYDTSFTAQDVVGGTNLMMKTLYKSNGAAANVGKEALLPGTYNWVWDAEADLAHRWVTYSGCLPTNSAVLFSNVQLSELSEFYAVPCGMSVSGKSNLAKGAYIKNDGTGKSVQFAFSDDVYTKCVCVHLEQSGANVVGHAKWARYASGTGHENSDFETNSATQLGVATSDSERGYGLHKLEAKGPKLDSAPVIERAIAEGNVEVSAFLYTVKFNANGGTGTMANESFAYGIEKALTANAFTRTGYTFQGWATSASGAIAYSNKQEVSNLSVTAVATVNLYAAWKANTYSVKFNANGGTGTMSNESFTYDTAKALTANAFTRTGYTFQGWATSASGAKVYSDKQSVNNLTATAGGTVNLYAVWKDALYMVIDLSGGSSATSYPITYLSAAPSNGFTNTTYRTTKLVLRRLEAGSFKMQGSTTTTLSKPYYMGVFEVTQKQWSLVMGSLPSKVSATYGKGDGYPVNFVSYSAIRGSSNGAKWPSSSVVDSTSFVGKLRARTKIDFDLPTEAQWERACRAGTTTTYYWGSSINSSYCWYDSNSSSTCHTVGLKKPNAWGLYDMSGNLFEWCLDWYGSLKYGTDPKGPSSGTNRHMRGGSWNHTLSCCTSSYRCYGGNGPSSGDQGSGFRLCVTLP